MDAQNQCVYLAHADCIEEANNLKQLIMDEIKCKDVYINYMGPIIGASVGPSAIAIFGFGKEVTFGG